VMQWHPLFAKVLRTMCKAHRGTPLTSIVHLRPLVLGAETCVSAARTAGLWVPKHKFLIARDEAGYGYESRFGRWVVAGLEEAQ
jgi:hypothetical protein